MSNTQKTKQIAKNTVVLYVRMIVTMLITLFSSRIVLQALGVSDFGLYNVVGGVVALISFLRASLASSTQRFISYEIGRNDTFQLKKVFSISVSTHFLISVLILIVAETLGLWFLNNYIQIPLGRENAAFWIYQFSVVSLCISAITIPYSADVISHERMSYYAFVTIIEAVLKLAFAYALFLFGTDKLILYGGLMMLINFIDFFLYYVYCRRKFYETKYEFYFDKQLFKQIFSFSGWTVFGQLSVIGANQGTSILINMFHSLAANAAIGISQQVNNAISGLTANFHTAFQPQLTKSYAANDYDYMNSLICKTSKISYFLLFLAAIPIVVNIDLILKIWLGENVPIYTSQFCVLFLAASLCNAISAPLWTSIYATGQIRNYQIVTSLIFLSDILIVYLLFFYFGCSPVVAMEVKLIINVLIVLVRVLYTKKVVPGFSVLIYIKKCLTQVFLVTIITVTLSSLIFVFEFDKIERLLLSIPLLIISCLVSFRIGFSIQERQYLVSIINKYKNISIMIDFLKKLLRGGLNIKTYLIIKDLKKKVTLVGFGHRFNKNSRVNLQWGASKDNVILNDHSEMFGSIVAINKGRVVMGEWSKIGYSTITCVNSVEIGAETAIADGCTISDHSSHPINPEDRRYMRHTPHNAIERAPMFSSNAPIKIGCNVWIGSNVRICKGVTIGDNSVIGANTVVTKDIPANCVAVGNPARVVKTDIDKNTKRVFPLS